MAGNPINVFGRSDDIDAIAKRATSALEGSVLDREGDSIRITYRPKRRAKRSGALELNISISLDYFAGNPGRRQRLGMGNYLADTMRGAGIEKVLAIIPDLKVAVAIVPDESIVLTADDPSFALALDLADAADGFAVSLEDGQVWSAAGDLLASAKTPAASAAPHAKTSTEPSGKVAKVTREAKASDKAPPVKAAKASGTPSVKAAKAASVATTAPANGPETADAPVDETEAAPTPRRRRRRGKKGEEASPLDDLSGQEWAESRAEADAEWAPAGDPSMPAPSGADGLEVDLDDVAVEVDAGAEAEADLPEILELPVTVEPATKIAVEDAVEQRGTVATVQEDDVDAVDDEEPSPDAPSVDRVVARLVVVTAVGLRGLAEAEGEDLADIRSTILAWVSDLGVDEEFEPWERAIVDAGPSDISEDDQVDASWRIEGAAVLAWALRLFDVPAFDQLVDPQALRAGLGFPDPDTTAARMVGAELRPPGQLKAVAAQMFAVHWRLRQFLVDPGELDFAAFATEAPFGPLRLQGVRLIEGDLAVRNQPISEVDSRLVRFVTSTVSERHLAARWLLHGGVYSETDVST